MDIHVLLVKIANEKKRNVDCYKKILIKIFSQMKSVYGSPRWYFYKNNRSTAR